MQGNSLLEDLVIWDAAISLITDEDLWSKKGITKKNDKSYWVWQQTLWLENSEQLIMKLKYLHKKFFKETDNIQKKGYKWEIDNIEKDLIRIKCEEEVSRIQSQIDNFELKYKIHWGAMWDKEAKQLAKYHEGIYKIKKVEEKFKNDNIRPFFPWKLHFGEIFQERWWFDVVIGNPPYIQLQKNWWILWNMYENTWFKSFAKTGDIYGLFYEFSIQLLRKWWISTMITSNKWMRAWYWEKLREYFVNNTDPLILVDLWSDVFESATVDSNILILQKKKVEQFYLKWLDLSKEKEIKSIEKFNDKIVKITDLSKGSWVILSTVQLSIKRKIEKIWTPLKDWDIKINYWIKTWYNEAFIIDKQKKDELIAKDPKNAEIIKPLLRGRDIKKYYSDFAGLWLISTHNWYIDNNWNKISKVEINKYPVIKDYLDIYWDEILKRYDKWDTPYNLRNCAYYKEFEKEKIVYSEIVQSPQFYHDMDSFYWEATVFILTWEYIKYLSCLLNSSFTFWVFRSFYAGWGLNDTWVRYKKKFLINLPIPKLIEQEQKPFIEKVDKIIEITKIEWYDYKNPPQEQMNLEKDIDVMVYKLYELTYDEVLIVDSEFWMGREEYEGINSNKSN